MIINNNNKIMKTLEILKNIRENGGFHNLNNWNNKEVAEWVYYNYNCSCYMAHRVAFYLI